MVHPSSRTARSTSLDSSSAVRDDGVPERELRVRLTAGSGHSGIVTLAVGGEGAYWLEEAPAEATIVFVARHALAMLEGRVDVDEPPPSRSLLLLRFLDDSSMSPVDVFALVPSLLDSALSSSPFFLRTGGTIMKHRGQRGMEGVRIIVAACW